MSVKSPSSTARASDQRRRLVLGGSLGLLILFQTCAGLFALWYSHKAAADNRNEMIAITDTLNLARSARYNFGTQLQEWKNILLRDFDPDLSTRHRANFQKEAAEVQADIALALNAQTFANERFSAIRSAHSALLELYNESLRTADLTTVAGQRALDTAVRGRDRALQVQFDELAAALTEAHRAEATRAALAEDRQFTTMRQLLFICGGLGLLATGLVLMMLLRQR